MGFPHVRGGVSQANEAIASFPHVRGGVSLSYRVSKRAKTFSPRTWGCFQGIISSEFSSFVFPTYVGVFRLGLFPFISSPSFPHVRGGVSVHLSKLGESVWFSPRTWGCFPETVTAPNTGFPHVRGGVSRGKEFSPHTWGCFRGGVSIGVIYD